eukprot:m.177473 g.177473  ORF g.177473 m.177473 type:complete len:735 (+) comp24488_c0_seq1:681-2885(+)
MSDDGDAKERRRDRFQSERKRSSASQDRSGPHMDTPRPQGSAPPKRGRYEGDRPPRYDRDERGNRGDREDRGGSRVGLMPVPEHRMGRGPPPSEPPRGGRRGGGPRHEVRRPPIGLGLLARGPPLLPGGPNAPPQLLGRHGPSGPVLPSPAFAPPPRRPFKYSIKSLSEWSKTDAAKPVEGEADDEGKSLEVAARYFKFKLKATMAQAERIFLAHEGELWFREQYFGGAYERLRQSRQETVRRRCNVFMPFLDDDRLEGLTPPIPLAGRGGEKLAQVLRAIEAQLIESHPAVPNAGEAADPVATETKGLPIDADVTPAVGDGAAAEKVDSPPTKVTKPVRTAEEEEEALLLDYDEEEQEAEDAAAAVPTDEGAVDGSKTGSASETVAARANLTKGARRSFAVKIFLKVELSAAELEKALHKIAGFHKLAVAYPSELTKLVTGQRLLWATFTGVKVDATLRNLRRMVIDADPLLAHTQPEPSSPNPLRMAVSDRAIRAEEADLELMKNLITTLDTFEGLWSDEGETNPVLATESPLKHLLYLRVTHSLDFYTGLQMAHEDDMAQPLPFLTLPTTLTRVNQHFSTQCRDRLQGIAEVLNECEKFDVDSLVRTPEQAADGFVAKNTVALEDGTFQCPLSGKRFRGPAFVKTHIVSKYDGALKKYVASVAAMNPFMEDPFRVRVLPPVQGAVGGRGMPLKDQFGRDLPAGRIVPPQMLRSPPGNMGLHVRTIRRYDNL